MEKSSHKSLYLKPHAKVVIVGAGIAGVTAAAKLIHNGIKDVVLVEAQDYVGGRIKSMLVDNKSVDLGAQYIHGQEGNPLYEIAKKRGIIINEYSGTDFEERLVNTPDFFFSTNRGKIPYKEVVELIEHIEKTEENLNLSDIEEDVSEQDVYERAYNDFLEQHAYTLTPSQKEIFPAVHRWYCCYLRSEKGAACLSKISAWAAEEYVVLKGNRYTEAEGGMSGLLQLLVDLIPEGVIHTGLPVQHIDWEGADTSDGKIVLTCENGDVITTDHVIVTISIGCLKAKQDSMFHPPLPDTFLKAIHGVHLGAISKVFLQWDKPFWNNKQASGCVTDDKIYDFLWMEPFPVTLKSDKSKRKTKLGKPWWRDLFSCERIFEHDNVLVYWFLQDQTEVLEELEDNEVMEVLTELTQMFFFDRHVSKPKAIYREEWVNNPYIRGAYSYPNVSFQRCDEQHLARPIPSTKNPRLLFAGEALTLKHMATVHGAFITGERQAERVLNARGITKTINVVDLVTGR